jgi:hypothetical protein
VKGHAWLCVTGLAPALAAAAVQASAPPEHSAIYEYPAYGIPGPGNVSLMSPPLATAGRRWPAIWSNGGSANLVFSQDNRRVRLLAFDSAASNFALADTNGMRDVFVVRREHNAGHLRGQIELASVRSDGVVANGASSRPSLDGSTWTDPHCVAFDSTATNLDARDPTPDRDVYVHDVETGLTRLVSVGRSDAHDAVIDGRCRTLTFMAGKLVYVAEVATGRSFAVSRGTQADEQTNGRGAAYVRGRQVYYRSFSLVRRGARRLLRRGRERLVSDDRRGRPGNGPSGDPSLDDRGHYVAFQSRATDLCIHRCVGISRDRNGAIPDVFRRTLSRTAGTKDTMEMASFSYAENAQAGARSDHPAMSSDGENIVFDSDATNIGFPHGMRTRQANDRASSIFSWIFPRTRGYGNVKLFERRRACYAGCLAPESNPAISSRGNYLGYETTMTEFCYPNRERYADDRPRCPDFTDIFALYVGPSHEGFPLG